MDAEKILKGGFDSVAARAATLRMTESELVSQVDPPMSYVTYWRARTGETRTNASTRVLRRVEETLDRLERTNDD